MPNDPKGLTPAADILPGIIKPEQALVKPETRLARLLSVDQGEDADILFQHSVLCQTSMPYRDPGTARVWERRNGRVSMRIQAGAADNGTSWVEVGLPFGPKPRLVLYHLNTEALRNESPIIRLEDDSLTAFVRRTLGLDPGGRTIRRVKDQLARLAAADFRFGATFNDRTVTVKGNVIDGFELWMPRNEKQRVLWPTTVRFSQPYFDSLREHAVPLNEGAIRYLAPSAMGLDVYVWFAQRLHRVGKPVLVPWVGGSSLMGQFGQGYSRMIDFRRFFERVLKQVKSVYPAARFTVDEKGMTLRNSPPPVAPRGQLK